MFKKWFVAKGYSGFNSNLILLALLQPRSFPMLRASPFQGFQLRVRALHVPDQV